MLCFDDILLFFIKAMKLSHNQPGGVLGAVRRGLKTMATGAEVIGTIKGVYDAGRMVVGAVSAAAPYVAEAAPYIAALL